MTIYDNISKKIIKIFNQDNYSEVKSLENGMFYIRYKNLENVDLKIYDSMGNNIITILEIPYMIDIFQYQKDEQSFLNIILVYNDLIEVLIYNEDTGEY